MIKKWFQMQLTNIIVNVKIRYKKDIDMYGSKEYWTLPIDNKGDCEDFALEKQSILAKKGIESKIATCWTENGIYHAVLVVKLDNDTYILDNRKIFAKKFKNLPYKWDRIEGNGMNWYDITDNSLVQPPQGWIEYKNRQKNE